MPRRMRPIREPITDEASTQLHVAPQEVVDVVTAVGDKEGVVGCLRLRFLELGMGAPH